MSKGRKSGGKNFKPGESGNPNGRPALPADLKQARSLTRMAFERVVNKYLFMTPDQIKDVMADPATQALDVLVCQIIKAAAISGDTVRAEFLLARTIGKVPDKVMLTDVEREIQSMQDEELLEAAKTASRVLQDAREAKK